LPDSPLLRQSYGHALLESKNSADLDPAIQQLLESERLEEHSAFNWRLLASAWGRKAEMTKDQVYEAMVSYALADAGQLADRAMKGLPHTSPYWLRAQDIKLATTPENEDGKGDKEKKK
jgi:predicted Zn-dependent protease